MTQGRLDQLLRQPPERALDGLEREIWARIDAEDDKRRLGRRVIEVQAALVAILLAGGLAFGLANPVSESATARLDVFSPGPALAPSTLLLGHRS